MNLTKAKAAVLVGANKPFEIREFPISAAPAGMAKIRLVASGVCGTDIHIHRGLIPTNPPTIIGHEFIGCVEEIAEEDSKKCGISVGDNVIVDIAVPCGKCVLCRAGDDANCVNMGLTNAGSLDVAPYLYGGYTEYNYTPITNIIKIPAELDPTMTAVFACPGPTAIHAFRLAEQANCQIEKANVAVVQGLGPVGMFAVMYLGALGIKNVIAVTLEDPKREEMALKMGATEVMHIAADGSVDHIIKRAHELSEGGIGADVVFEASGSIKAVPQGMQMLRNRGTYLIPGQYSNSGNVEIAPQMITFNALHMIGSSQYSLSDVAAYLDFLKNNPQLHDGIKAMVTKYSVSDVNQAFDDAKARKNIKTVLVK